MEHALNNALDHNVPIVPVLAAPAELPKPIDHLTALDFSQKAAGMSGPYAQNAAQNAYAIKNELSTFR